MGNILKSLDEYIEYAKATKRFADVGFYKDIKLEIESSADRIKQEVLNKIDKEAYYLDHSWVIDTADVVEILNKAMK